MAVTGDWVDDFVLEHELASLAHGITPVADINLLQRLKLVLQLLTGVSPWDDEFMIKWWFDLDPNDFFFEVALEFFGSWNPL